MPSKEQAHDNDKASSKHQSLESENESLDILAQPQVHPAAIIQRVMLNPKSLTPQEVLRLQRAIGNQAVNRLLAQTIKHQSVPQKGDVNKEAERMGAKAIPTPQHSAELGIVQQKPATEVIQRNIYGNMATMWPEVTKYAEQGLIITPGVEEGEVLKIVNQNPQLRQGYEDVAENITHMNFMYERGSEPKADMIPSGGGNVYNIHYGYRGEPNSPSELETYIGFILHEMMHINATLQYNTNIGPGTLLDSEGRRAAHIANMNLPPPAAVPAGGGVAANQQEAMEAQMHTMTENWENLRKEAEQDKKDGNLDKTQLNYLINMEAGTVGRITYAEIQVPEAHYDTVLMDVLYYLVSERLKGTRTYEYATQMMADANRRRRTRGGVVASIPRV